MRVTESMRYRSFLADVNAQSEAASRLSRQATTGRKLLRPSDAPGEAVRQLRMRRQLDQSQDMQTRLDASADELKRSELAVDDAIQIYQRARELGIEGATSARTDADFEAIAIEAEQLFRDLVGLANRQVDGRFVFGGSETTSQPFSIDGDPPTGVTYHGDSVARSISPSPGLELRTGLPGDELFVNGTNVFDQLLHLRDAARAGDVDALANTQAAQLEDGLQKLVNSRTQIGALSRSVGQSADALAQQVLDDRASLANLEDVDLIQTLSDLQLSTNAREVALQVMARTSQRTLLDYLA